MTKKSVNLIVVGERLRSERYATALNQEDFGRLAGITRNSQALYESGKSPFAIDYLLRLSEHGVDIAYVVSGVRSETLLPIDDQLLLDKYHSLSPVMREIAHVMISSIGDKPDEQKRAEANFWLATPPGSSSGTLHSPRIDYKAEPAEQTE